MNQSTARFKSDTTIYTPHGLGVAYSNENLTDKAARAILKADPDAAALFSALPEAESDSDATSDTSAAVATSTTAPAVASQEPVLDYDLLADKVAERLRAGFAKAPAPAADQAAHTTTHLGIDGAPVAPGLDPTTTPLNLGAPSLSASTGGLELTTEVEPNGVEVTTGHIETVEEKRVRLSRMTTAQLVNAYRTELQAEPADGLTNDQLRQAISDHRVASVTTPDATTSTGTSLV